MSNSITLITKYITSILDKVYKKAAVTSILDAPSQFVMETSAAGTYMIPKISMQGLVDYAKSTGFTAGDANLAWEAWTLAYDRGRKFGIDRIDDQESAGILLANLASEFLRTKVAPEIDAIRFSRIAGTAGIGGAQADLTTASAAMASFKVATAVLDDAEVPEEGRVCFMTPTFYNLIEEAIGASRLITTNTPDARIVSYNGIRFVKAPETRMYDEITLATTGDGGYSAAVGAVGLNFMMIDPTAVLQVTKHAKGRLWSPDDNILSDGWLYDYRIYHDAKVLDNKKAGIYVHKQAAA